MEVRVHIGGCAPILLATCTRFCPSPSLTGSPARHPGLVPGPLALAPGPAAVGFLFLPGVAGADSSFPSSQLLSSPLKQMHILLLSDLGLHLAEERELS